MPMRDFKMEMYWRLPVFLQEAGLSLYSRYLDRIYYGDSFPKWVEHYRRWQKLSKTERLDWQDRRLKTVLMIAGTRVPLYQQSWADVDWKGVTNATELSRLPVLDKHSVRRDPQKLIVEGISTKSLWSQKTSGTTGTALEIYWPMEMVTRWWALYEVLVRNEAGVSQECPRAMMGGRPVVHSSQTEPPFWRFNRNWKQLYLSSFHVSCDTARSYVEAIRDYGIEWITGYGSAIAALADSALQMGLEPVDLRAAIVSGDTLLPEMRNSIETFFRCRCSDNYGQAEGVAMASECVYGKMHLLSAVGIIEIVREDGTPCQPGESGNVVATGLLNSAMPLIRYQVGDRAAWAQDQECRCGSPDPIIERIDGRLDDYIVTKTRRKIGHLAGFQRGASIHSSQLVQNQPGHAFLLVRPGRNYSRDDAFAVLDDIKNRVHDLEIAIVEVSEIPKTPQGKTIQVVRLTERPEMLSAYRAILGPSRSESVGLQGR